MIIKKLQLKIYLIELRHGEIKGAYIGFETGTGKEILKFFIRNHFKAGMLWLYCYKNSFYQKNNFTFLISKMNLVEHKY